MCNKVCKIDPLSGCEQRDAKPQPCSQGVQDLLKKPGKRDKKGFLNCLCDSWLMHSLCGDWQPRKGTEVKLAFPREFSLVFPII